MAPGALVAAAAAAHARRMQEVQDAFRVGGATSPARALSAQGLGIGHALELRTLVDAGVVVAGPRAGTWYLDEARVIARRDQTRGAKPVVVLAIVVLTLALLIGLTVMIRESQRAWREDPPRQGATQS